MEESWDNTPGQHTRGQASATQRRGSDISNDNGTSAEWGQNVGVGGRGEIFAGGGGASMESPSQSDGGRSAVVNTNGPISGGHHGTVRTLSCIIVEIAVPLDTHLRS